MSYSFVFFLISAFIFAATFFDGGIECILAAIPLALIGLVVLYFEDRPSTRKERKLYTPKKFLTEWYDNGRGLLFSIGIYAILVLCSCGIFGLISWCTPHTPSRPYHDAETGEGQYEYGGSREQKRDLERIDDYIKNHPDE